MEYIYKNSDFQTKTGVFLFYSRSEAGIYLWLFLDYREEYFP